MRAKKTFTEECGCKYDGDKNRWISYCIKHQKELDETHKRACEDYRNWFKSKETHHE